MLRLCPFDLAFLGSLFRLGSDCSRLLGTLATVDDINPALPIIRNIPDFPQFRVLKVLQD